MTLNFAVNAVYYSVSIRGEMHRLHSSPPQSFASFGWRITKLAANTHRLRGQSKKENSSFMM